MSGARTGLRVAYLTTRYPAISHSFIQREVLALRGLGADIETISIHPPIPADLFTAEDRAEAARTASVRSRAPWGIALDHLHALLRHPRAYLSTLRFAAGNASSGRALSPLFHFAEAVVVWQICRRRGIRHIHAHFTSPSADVALLAAELGERARPGTLSWSFTAHGTDILGDSPARLAEKVRRAALTICVSDDGHAQLMGLVEETYWDRVRVIRCGLDARWRHADLPSSGRNATSGDRPLRILTVGRLEREKGHGILLEALAALVSHGLDVELRVVGDGSQRRRLTERVAELEIDSRVAFVGKAGQDRIQEHYADADLFCLPSLGEGVPVVLMEAMAMGVPVIATRVGGVPELVEHGVSGLLAPPADPVALAEAIATLAEDPEARERMGTAGRRRVFKQHDIERVAGQLFDALSQVARPAPAGPLEVAMAPADRGNPYQVLLSDALARRGAKASQTNRIRLRYAASADRHTSVIHLHWLEFIVRSTDSGWGATAQSLVRALHLLLALGVARLRGIRIVWTVHNLEPHEAKRPWIDRLIARRVARLSDTVLAHSRYCASQVSERTGRVDIEVAYHGDYVDFYPPPRNDRGEVRRALGLPEDAHVLLAFGLIRPYKEIAELIAEFRTVGDPDLRLLIAGRPLNDEVRRQVEAAADGDPRVVLKLERIPDAEVAELHQAADVAVLAYGDVFSSGALMLALSHGLPAVTPRDSTAAELASAPAIRLFAPGMLGEALVESAPTDVAARGHALSSARRYDWDAMAAKVLGAAPKEDGSE
jgi:colanic acid/amylovoran biosynthesis glycosyltransferase